MPWTVEGVMLKNAPSFVGLGELKQGCGGINNPVSSFAA
jgi:hypothetical protein